MAEGQQVNSVAVGAQRLKVRVVEMEVADGNRSCKVV